MASCELDVVARIIACGDDLQMAMISAACWHVELIHVRNNGIRRLFAVAPRNLMLQTGLSTVSCQMTAASPARFWRVSPADGHVTTENVAAFAHLHQYRPSTPRQCRRSCRGAAPASRTSRRRSSRWPTHDKSPMSFRCRRRQPCVGQYNDDIAQARPM